MAPIPVENAIESPTAAEIEQRLRQLEAEWKRDTAYISDADRIIDHPAFQRIIGLGEGVVPFLLKDLAARHCLWVWALPDITGADPVAEADRGNIAAMSTAWLRWGREQGYRW